MTAPHSAHDTLSLIFCHKSSILPPIDSKNLTWRIRTGGPICFIRYSLSKMCNPDIICNIPSKLLKCDVNKSWVVWLTTPVSLLLDLWFSGVLPLFIFPKSSLRPKYYISCFWHFLFPWLCVCWLCRVISTNSTYLTLMVSNSCRSVTEHRDHEFLQSVFPFLPACTVSVDNTPHIRGAQVPFIAQKPPVANRNRAWLVWG